MSRAVLSIMVLCFLVVLASFSHAGSEQRASFHLTIYDAKTRFVLWTMLAPVEGAFPRDSFVRNLNQAVGSVLADLKNLQGRAGKSDRAPAK